MHEVSEVIGGKERNYYYFFYLFIFHIRYYSLFIFVLFDPSPFLLRCLVIKLSWRLWWFTKGWGGVVIGVSVRQEFCITTEKNFLTTLLFYCYGHPSTMDWLRVSVCPTHAFGVSSHRWLSEGGEGRTDRHTHTHTHTVSPRQSLHHGRKVTVAASPQAVHPCSTTRIG